MNDQHRPGGLTALAVINFVFAALAILTVLALAALLPLLAENATAANEQQRAQIEALTSLGKAPFVLVVASSAISGALLILSGIGYLQQKKFLGRTLGNAYAVFAIVAAIPLTLWLPRAVGGGFNLSTLLTLAYPVLTLALVNFTFKEDLTR